MSTFTERSARALVDAARADAAPVAWIQPNEPDLPIDDAEWQLGPELQPQRRVGALIICGAQTNNCDLTKTAQAFA